MNRFYAAILASIFVHTCAHAETIGGKVTDTVLLYVGCEADRNAGLDAVTRHYGSQASVIAGRDEARAGDVEAGRNDVIFSADGNQLPSKGVFVDPKSVQEQPGKWVAIVRTFVEPWRFTAADRGTSQPGELLESQCNGQACFFLTPNASCSQQTRNGMIMDEMTRGGMNNLEGGVAAPLGHAIGDTLRQALDRGVNFD